MNDISIQEGFVRDPRFIYGSEAQKIQTIQKYRQLIAEFDKIRELRSFLSIVKDHPEIFSKLVTSMSELDAILSTINEGEEHVVDDGTLDRIKKVGAIYDGVAKSYVQSTFKISDVSLNNMQEICSPLKNGMFQDLLQRRDYLVKKGMMIEEATRVAEEYCLRTQELSKGPYKFYRLIESDQEDSQSIIKKFHETSNFQLIDFHTPTLNEFRSSVKERHAKAGSLYGYLQAGGNINVYNKLANKSFTKSNIQKPIKANPKSLFSYSIRNFCSKPEPEEPKKESGFTAYLKKLIQVDKKKEEDQKLQSHKNLESILTKDPSEIKIGFHKIKSSITLEGSEEQPSAAQDAAEPINQEQFEEKVKTEEELLVEEANKKFGVNFFKEFALNDETMTRKSLEEYIKNMHNKEDIPLFIASFLKNAYKLNSWIPNCHMVFYNMFCSPKINQEERKEIEKSDLLGGNIFDHQLPLMGYNSLLHSVLITGKKKHFKKILEHIDKYVISEDPNKVIPLVSSIISIADAHNFPILLGKTMKYYLEKGVQITKEDYIDFYMHLD